MKAFTRQRLSRRCEVKLLTNYTWSGREAVAHLTSFLFGALLYKYSPPDVLLMSLFWMIISGWSKDKEV